VTKNTNFETASSTKGKVETKPDSFAEVRVRSKLMIVATGDVAEKVTIPNKGNAKEKPKK
jgi:hypothetical protein